MRAAKNLLLAKIGFEPEELGLRVRLVVLYLLPANPGLLIYVPIGH